MRASLLDKQNQTAAVLHKNDCCGGAVGKVRASEPAVGAQLSRGNRPQRPTVWLPSYLAAAKGLWSQALARPAGIIATSQMHSPNLFRILSPSQRFQ
jgi:hypothetical protein